MRAKFLSILMAVIGCNVIAAEVVELPQPWHGSHYGICYPALESAMAGTYGPGFKDDQNIVQERRRIGSRKFVIGSDTTSGTNSQRTVFEWRASDGWCVVLTSPPVADLKPGPESAGIQRPATWTAVTQAPPGFPEIKVVFEWAAKEKVYKPTICYKRGGNNWKRLDCNDAFQ